MDESAPMPSIGSASGGGVGSPDTMSDQVERDSQPTRKHASAIKDQPGEPRMQTIPMTMQDILHAAHSRCRNPRPARDCLAYPDLDDVVPAFNRLAHTDFAILSEADERLEWEDYCPAYALGLLTFEAYFHQSSRTSEANLKEQWDELRGSSRLAWEQARAIIARSWNALIPLERRGRL